MAEAPKTDEPRVQTFDDVDSWHRVTMTDFGRVVRVKVGILPGRAYWTEPSPAKMRQWVDAFIGPDRWRNDTRQRTAHTVVSSTYVYGVTS